ncbi:hypothetical protein CEXT_355881 [Caerostris extrusa]|uniref:Uncharacterized protein n=1 Tax=Caerostris extrusa TaxID=172846 RepID=A0AAV4PSV1_CAEEX|nr:hypothetical protein CEXT_355881 [Caerostris extrusa]
MAIHGCLISLWPNGASPQHTKDSTLGLKKILKWEFDFQNKLNRKKVLEASFSFLSKYVLKEKRRKCSLHFGGLPFAYVCGADAFYSEREEARGLSGQENGRGHEEVSGKLICESQTCKCFGKRPKRNGKRIHKNPLPEFHLSYVLLGKHIANVADFFSSSSRYGCFYLPIYWRQDGMPLNMTPCLTCSGNRLPISESFLRPKVESLVGCDLRHFGHGYIR